MEKSVGGNVKYLISFSTAGAKTAFTIHLEMLCGGMKESTTQQEETTNCRFTHAHNNLVLITSSRFSLPSNGSRCKCWLTVRSPCLQIIVFNHKSYLKSRTVPTMRRVFPVHCTVTTCHCINRSQSWAGCRPTNTCTCKTWKISARDRNNTFSHILENNSTILDKNWANRMIEDKWP